VQKAYNILIIFPKQAEILHRDTEAQVQAIYDQQHVLLWGHLTSFHHATHALVDQHLRWMVLWDCLLDLKNNTLFHTNQRTIP
jgi:hypothetical protein